MLFKYFIKLGLNTLIDLLGRSLSDSSKAKRIIDIVLFIIKRLLDILTDDDRDNTAQIEKLLLNEFPEHLQALGYSFNLLQDAVLKEAANTNV